MSLGVHRLPRSRASYPVYQALLCTATAPAAPGPAAGAPAGERTTHSDSPSTCTPRRRSSRTTRFWASGFSRSEMTWQCTTGGVRSR